MRRRRLWIGLLTLSACALAGSAFLLFSPSASAWLLQLVVHRALRPQALRIARVEGNLATGLRAYDLQLSGLPSLPEGTALQLQRLNVTVAPRDLLKSRVVVVNGRLRLPESEPIQFSGTAEGGEMHLRVDAHALDVRHTLDLFLEEAHLGNLAGTLDDVQVWVEGPWAHPRLTGTFLIEQLSRGAFRLERCPGMLAVDLQRWQPPAMQGTVGCERGIVTVRQARIRVEPSRLHFTGDIRQPTLELTGRASVQQTRIYLRVTGPLADPQLVVSSSPMRDRAEILLMLATGKSWQSAQEALRGGAVSSELVTDFFDYLLFGGVGNSFGRRVGISELAVTHHPDTGSVGLRTTVKDTVSVGIEVDPAAVAASRRTETSGTPPTGPLPFKAEAELRLNPETSVAIEGERKPIHQTPAADAATAETPGQPVEDRILLKLRKEF